jgi:hypothetical protein
MGRAVRCALWLCLGIGYQTAIAADVNSLFRAIGNAAQQAIGDQQRRGGGQETQTGGESPPTGIPQSSTNSNRNSPPAGFNRSGTSIDTPENLELIRTRLAERVRGAGPAASPMQLMGACKAEMGPLAAYESVVGSGYEELMRKCEAEQRAAIVDLQSRREQAGRDRRDASEKARAEVEAAEKEKEEAQIRVLTAELRSGKRQPENCAQWMIVKGQDPQSLNAKVTEVSLQPPSGIGSFAGRVEQINGGTLLVSDQPVIRMRGQPQGFYVVNVGSQAKLFRGDQIKVGTVIAGFASQSATKNLRMTDSSVQQAPVLQVTCAQAVF